MEAASLSPAAPARAERCSPALLRLAPDEALVERVRAGSEEAFTALYERHYRSILSYCRHMLRSREEGEDAVQQTFINAYRGMLSGDKELNLRPWLYRIARNHCISTMRSRRPVVEVSEEHPSLVGLAQEVGSRSDLREMFRDLASLPDEQREALILTELHDNSHVEAAEIIGCDKEKVKSLVFQARSSLMKSKEARDVSCEDIRSQLSVLRGGSLRRSLIRRHVTECEGCRGFDHEVKRQRQAMALILPVIPTAALKGGAGTAIAAGGMNGFSSVGASGLAAAGSVGPPVAAASVSYIVSPGSLASAASAASVGSAATTGVGGAGVGSIVSTSVTSIAGKLGVSAALVKGVVATVAVSAVVAGGVTGPGVVRQAEQKILGTSQGKSADAQHGKGGSAQGIAHGHNGRDGAAAKRGRQGSAAHDPSTPRGLQGKQEGKQGLGRPEAPGSRARADAPGQSAGPGDHAAPGRPDSPGDRAAPNGKSGGASPPAKVTPTPDVHPTPKTPPAYGRPDSTPAPTKSQGKAPVLPSAVPLDVPAP
jgi:RNA polymerase sigma factor (sigma-70 family)